MKRKSYIQSPQELRNSMKGVINLKNKDNECFRWCHIRYLNLQSKDSQLIKKVNTAFVDQLDYSVDVKQYNKIEKQSNINIIVFGYENKQPYPVYVWKEKFDNVMNLLLITDGENKHCVLIKDFIRFMFNQTKHQHKQFFCTHCLQCISKESIPNKHKTDCIVLNGEQAITMPEKGETITDSYKRHL